MLEYGRLHRNAEESATGNERRAIDRSGLPDGTDQRPHEYVSVGSPRKIVVRVCGDENGWISSRERVERARSGRARRAGAEESKGFRHREGERAERALSLPRRPPGAPRGHGHRESRSVRHRNRRPNRSRRTFRSRRRATLPLRSGRYAQGHVRPKQTP
jgi:hypothetical protein